MFSLKMVARPDARMVEVPLEIEAELPRDFEGAAVLSSSGLPRKVRIKAQRDALKLSTAYRADQLLADVVRTVLRGSPIDIERVQIAAKNFVRAVRERRQDGATLMVESNGRGRIQVKEAMPPPREPRSAVAAVKRAVEGTVSDRITALERRLDQLEAKLARGGAVAPGPDRVSTLEKRLAALEERPAGAAVGEPARGVLKGRGTAIEPFAEGLRAELRDRVAAQRKQAQEAAARCDKAAALAVEAERVLRAPREGVSQHLQTVSAQAAARVQALERVHGEVELYAASDLPLAERLVARLIEGPLPADPTGSLERQAQALVRATRKENGELRAWLSRAAALCGWELIDPVAGEPLSTKLHVAVDSGGDHVARVAAPGVRRKDRSILCRARVLVSVNAGAEAHSSTGAEEVELLAEEFADEQIAQQPSDDTPPPIDSRPPTQPLRDEPAVVIEPTQRLAMPHPAAAETPLPPVESMAAKAPTPAEELPSPHRPAIPAVQEVPAPQAAPPPQAVHVPQAVPAESIHSAEADPALGAFAATPAVPSPAAPVPAKAERSTAPETRATPASVAPAVAARDIPPATHEALLAAAELMEPAPVERTAPPPPIPTEADLEPEREIPPAAGDPGVATKRVSQGRGEDDLALATEVAAAVDTEIDEDPEWALLARGPAAFPVDEAEPEVSPPDGDDGAPGPGRPRD